MRLAALLLSLAVADAALAVDIRVLAAGAVEPGLAKIVEQYRKETSNRVRLQFLTSQQLERRFTGGDSAEVLIASSGFMSDQLRRNKLEAETHAFIGRVGIGVTVRASSPDPDIASLERFRQSLLGAEAVVYSQSSAGSYLERLFDLLGMAEQLKTRTTRYVNFAQVFEHLMGGRGTEIGFGAITEIRQFETKGLKLVGPLPEQVQSSIAYSVAVATDAPEAETAREFVKYLATPAAKAILAAAGIE